MTEYSRRSGIDLSAFQWTREPEEYTARDGRIEIVTKPRTDLWQRTYYHFRNDSAPVFQMETGEKYFSFTVKADFHESRCGSTSAVWCCIWTARIG